MLATLLLALAQQSSFGVRGDMSDTEWAKTVAIQRELSQPSLVDWAGDYGDMLIAPHNGAISCFRSCMSPLYTTAGVRAEGHRLELTTDDVPPRFGVWWVVHWGERRYIVPEAGLRRFCMDVNDGSEPRNDGKTGFWLHSEDLRRTAHGQPELPAPWQELVLSSPLQTSILRVERTHVLPTQRDDRATATRVLLLLGTQDGVRVDLGFHLGDGRRVIGFVESVAPSTCVVLVDDWYEARAQHLKPGDYAGTKRPE